MSKDELDIGCDDKMIRLYLQIATIYGVTFVIGVIILIVKGVN